jgi:peptide/nickel transport system permease protein
LNGIKHLILPLFCFSYGSVASFSLLSQNHVLQLKKEAWFITAKAKGLSNQRALWVHAVPNALPLLQTRFFQSLPYVLSGSVVLETLFSLPGLGAIGVKAVFNHDQALLIGLLMVGAFLTLIGFVLSDSLQYLLDPRGRKPIKP